jgi:hypothetical protein
VRCERVGCGGREEAGSDAAALAHDFVSNESMDPSTWYEPEKKCKVTAKK